MAKKNDVRMTTMEMMGSWLGLIFASGTIIILILLIVWGIKSLMGAIF